LELFAAEVKGHQQRRLQHGSSGIDLARRMAAAGLRAERMTPRAVELLESVSIACVISAALAKWLNRPTDVPA
jgi:hypothetical protein